MPKAEIAFQPGRFSPVVEVSQRQSGAPAPTDTDFSGLVNVTESTLSIATASARGSGATLNGTIPIASLSLVIATCLIVRNIVEQLSFLNVHTKFSAASRSPKLDLLEPLVRAYNFYGHFDHDGKTFVTRALEKKLIFYLFKLVDRATPETTRQTSHTAKANESFKDIDLDFYSLLSSGEVGFQRTLPLDDYTVEIISYLASFDIPVEEKLTLIRLVTDISTEDALLIVTRRLKRIPKFEMPDRSISTEPTAGHKAAMKRLFGKDYSSQGDIIPTSAFVSAINNAYSLARNVTLELSPRMKTLPLPKYEGGSACQMAYLDDDVLVSDVPLSLVDSTAALAFVTAYGSTARFKSAPGLERPELLRELVAQSLITR